MNFMQLRERQPKFPVTVKTGEGVVELIWNKIEYADGYRVFASPVGKNHFVGVINVKGTTAVMKNVRTAFLCSIRSRRSELRTVRIIFRRVRNCHSVSA